MKLEFFVSAVCEDSPPAIELMATTGLSYEKINITGSIPALKRFLVYRDTLPEFAAIKKQGYVGVPLLVVNNGDLALFDFDDADQVINAVRRATLGERLDLRQSTNLEENRLDDKMRKDLGL